MRCRNSLRMEPVSDNEVRWYVLGCTSPRRELKIRDDARRYGLTSFVPLKYEVKTVKGQERRLLVPAVTKLVFVKGTLTAVQDYLLHAHFVVFIQRSTFSGHKDYLTVPTDAMENFIAVAEQTERHVTYFRPDEIVLREGDKIRVKGGLYDGREGIVMRIKGKRNKHLVVQIPGILIAAVEMTPEMIELSSAEGPKPKRKALAARGAQEPVDGPSKTKLSKSKDLDKDKKLVFELAHRLLFGFSDKFQNENEYYLLRSELQRAKQRIMNFKGFTASSEAELALPLFMAAVMLEEGLPEAQSRLQKAVQALKPTSLLRVRSQLYLAILSHDSALLAELSALFASWRKAPLSIKQRALLEEYSLLTSSK